MKKLKKLEHLAFLEEIKIYCPDLKKKVQIKSEHYGFEITDGDRDSGCETCGYGADEGSANLVITTCKCGKSHTINIKN